jgi:hypothetical protein
MSRKILSGFVIAILSLSATSPMASAALPPYYQTAREIQAVVENGDLAQKIGSGRAITSITRKDGGYTVIASECEVFVKVVYEAPPEGLVGAARFHLEVATPLCAYPPALE